MSEFRMMVHVPDVAKTANRFGNLGLFNRVELVDGKVEEFVWDRTANVEYPVCDDAIPHQLVRQIYRNTL